MSRKPDGPPAVPLWINGHPYLTVTERFLDVRDAQSGEVLRRVPVCGAHEVAVAREAAESAQPVWAEMSVGDRQERLAAVAQALGGYAEHFAQLIVQETGKSEGDAAAEVEAARAALLAGRVGEGALLAVRADGARPLAGPIEAAAPALLAGGVVVCQSSPQAPGAAFAWCELTARAGWPGGVFNLVHGDAETGAALAAIPSTAASAGEGKA